MNTITVGPVVHFLGPRVLLAVTGNVTTVLVPLVFSSAAAASVVALVSVVGPWVVGTALGMVLGGISDSAVVGLVVTNQSGFRTGEVARTSVLLLLSRLLLLLYCYYYYCYYYYYYCYY